jgi:hypothetical protein
MKRQKHQSCNRNKAKTRTKTIHGREQPSSSSTLSLFECVKVKVIAFIRLTIKQILLGISGFEIQMNTFLFPGPLTFSIEDLRIGLDGVGDLLMIIKTAGTENHWQNLA